MNVTRWKSDLIGAPSGWQSAGDWSEETCPSNPAAAPGAAMTKDPKLMDLAIFTGADGGAPIGGLIADAAGNLFGTASRGGAGGVGTVFEIAKTGSGYAAAPTTLVSFSGADGAFPDGSLIEDAAGDLFGVTQTGGTYNDGVAFEIAKTNGGYAGAPTILVSFSGPYGGEYPYGSLTLDTAGNLFGATSNGGDDGDGTVFEIAKTDGGYADEPTTLVSFTGANGTLPSGGLIADAAGDLFGTTGGGGIKNNGNVFEIVKTQDGYADTPTILVSFTGADGALPSGGVIADAAGDLFGTTYYGGTKGDGTVFEIAKTEGGYADTPTTLVSFTGHDGRFPGSSLIFDAAGDLFGTTEEGGIKNNGTVFEIVATKDGYAGAPTTIATFKSSRGTDPVGSLLADASGDLFGTTALGGVDDYGAVFEIKHSGFVPPTAPAAPAETARPSPLGAAFVQAMASHGQSGFGGNSPAIFAFPHETRTLLAPPNIA
jgi:uncharacterized repeat protein (TIGR03803 family)